MAYQFRPAVREHTPLIVGIAGPTKAGKSYSALRVAKGLANGKPVAMINAEGARGHQYADMFQYVACDIVPPFRPTNYTQALKDAALIKPGAIIIDSGSHMWDGPGGVLEWHEEILDDMAGKDRAKRERATFAAWVVPKAAENQFIYEMLGLDIPIVLCLRAKEKLKIIGGKPVDMGWQPIVGERVAFETLFTLMLPPHSKGVPDLTISDMREPFDTMIPKGKQLDEDLGRQLAAWAKGGTTRPAAEPTSQRAAHEPGAAAGGATAATPDPIEADVLDLIAKLEAATTQPAGQSVWKLAAKLTFWEQLTTSQQNRLTAAKEAMKQRMAEKVA